MPLTYEIGIMNPRPLKERSRKRTRKSRAGGGSMKLKRNKFGRFLKRSSGGTHKKRRRRRAPTLTNPSSHRRRRRRHAKRRHINPSRRRTRYVVRHSVRRRRRINPRGLAGLTSGGRGIVPQVVAGGIGAAGALGLDVILGYVSGMSFYPEALKTGTGRNLVRLGGALGVGFLAGKAFGGKIGKAVALGGLTVVLYTVLKELVAKAAPTLPGLGDYEDMQIGYLDAASVIQDGTGAYLEEGTGAYMEGDSEMEGAGAYMEF